MIPWPPLSPDEEIALVELTRLLDEEMDEELERIAYENHLTSEHGIYGVGE